MARRIPRSYLASRAREIAAAAEKAAALIESHPSELIGDYTLADAELEEIQANAQSLRDALHEDRILANKEVR